LLPTFETENEPPLSEFANPLVSIANSLALKSETALAVAISHE